MNRVVSLARPAAHPTLQPSDYTGVLMQALRTRPDFIVGVHAVEIGSGSGVVLAALASLGAGSLCGVDIEAEAVLAGSELMDGLGFGAICQFHRGNLWEPVRGQRFDLVVANLPHFPMTHGKVPGRRASWSSGGADGRRLLDPFLHELATHLAPGGRAVITHNGFVGLDRSLAILSAQGLGLKILSTTLVHLSQEKLDLMTEATLADETGHTIFRYGPYTLGEIHVVEIGFDRAAT